MKKSQNGTRHISQPKLDNAVDIGTFFPFILPNRSSNIMFCAKLLPILTTIVILYLPVISLKGRWNSNSRPYFYFCCKLARNKLTEDCSSCYFKKALLNHLSFFTLFTIFTFFKFLFRNDEFYRREILSRGRRKSFQRKLETHQSEGRLEIGKGNNNNNNNK